MAELFELMDAWGPEKVVAVSDRKTGMKGTLVIDNTARGMGKGGTRMQPGVSVQEISRLARVMTWKWAAADLFFGGAKAGIQADPKSPDKEAILRSFVRRLSNEVPQEYVFGLDMGLTENDAAVIIDELGSRGASVGTPAELGGVPYDQLGVTGYGIGEVVDEVAEKHGLGQASVAIQGFGAVGHAAAQRLDELEYRVIAISTAYGALADPNGLDIPLLLKRREAVGDALIEDFPQLRISSGDELRTQAEILVPAAVQDVIDVDLAEKTQARLIIEAANLPTTDQAQQVLHQRGVTVVPDFIANAGGVVAGAYAMETRYSPFRVEPARIFETISQKLRANTQQVLAEADARSIRPHEAAWALAQERVRTAMALRGQR